MACCRYLAALLMLTTTAAAQTPPTAATPAAPGATAPASTPAPMPDPLMSPDLQRITPSAPNLASLVQQSAWQDPLIAAAREQYKLLPEACAAAVIKPTGQLTVFNPAQFDPRGTLISGVWSERVNVTGCGAPRVLNVLTLLEPGSAPQRFATLPGDTHADPATQKNALQYAQAVAIRASPPNCRQQIFTNTKFEGYTGLPDTTIRDGRQTRAWVEAWSLFACGTTYVIHLTFRPNAQGLQLSATNPVKQP